MIYEDASGHVFRRSPQHLKKPKHTWCSRCGGYVALRELPDLEQKRLRKHHGESIIRKHRSERIG